MKLQLKRLHIEAGRPIAFIHVNDAKKLKVHPGDRISLSYHNKQEMALVDVVSGFLHIGQIGLSTELASFLNAPEGAIIDFSISIRTFSSHLLEGNLKCRTHTRPELKRIIKDVVNNALSEAEIAYFIAGVNYCGMSLKETQFLTQAIVETGKRIKWGSRVIADKHSIGGIPGNRTTPIVVSICAAAGVTMPKTSSRAITSAAGTADVIEVVARVDFSLAELKAIVKKTGACLAWGGALGLAPADDKLIQVEKQLDLDPEPQLLASILSKKLAVGSTHVLIDIPYGAGAKVSKEQALNLKKKFISLGRGLKLHIQVALTDGKQPIGNGIGPVLEIKDALRVLKRDNPPRDLENKSLLLAGKILEMVGAVRKGNGRKRALQLLNSGAALAKFKEIVEAQKGHLDGLPEASYSHTILASRSSSIKAIHNRLINPMAHVAGCPQDKAAGIYLYKHVGEKVKKGQPICTVYTESSQKLKNALVFYQDNHPIELE